jgi:hypothetical protein
MNSSVPKSPGFQPIDIEKHATNGSSDSSRNCEPGHNGVGRLHIPVSNSDKLGKNDPAGKDDVADCEYE